MIISITPAFDRDFERLPEEVREATKEAIQLLETNPHHPSLRTSKLAGTKLWYCRITDDYRMTFHWEGDEITLRVVDSHDEALRRSRRLSPLK